MSADTSKKIIQLRDEIFSKMSGDEKIRLAFDMSEEAKQICCDGIRIRNPNYSPKQIRNEWLKVSFGEELASKFE